MSNFRQCDRETPYLLPPSLDDWWKAYSKADLPDPTNVPDQPVTSGAYQWTGFDFDQNGRFVPSDGSGAALERMLNHPTNSARPSEINACFIDPALGARRML